MQAFRTSAIINSKNHNKHRGQAMVEFIVTASFVLVPLFLMIPLLTKYIEMQQLTVQAARYQAWEYTVWFRENKDVPANFNEPKILGMVEPVKSLDVVKKESYQRFFSDTSTELSAFDGVGWKTSNANPFLSDYQGNRIYNGGNSANINYNQPTPDLTAKLPIPLIQGKGVVNFLVDIIAGVSEILSKAASFVGLTFPAFTVLNSGGYQQVEVNTLSRNAPVYNDMRSTLPLFGKNLNLQFNAKAAVLSEGWNAGGRIHAKTEAESLVFTRILREPFNFLAKAVAILPFPAAGDLQHLDWGHTDSEAIPPEYLDPSGTTSCDNKGYCSY